MSPLIDSFISSLIHLFSFFFFFLGNSTMKSWAGEPSRLCMVLSPFLFIFFFLRFFVVIFRKWALRRKSSLTLNQFLASFLGLSSFLQLQGI